MAEFIDINRFDEEPELSEMSREELLALLDDIKKEIAELDEKEPSGFESGEYEEWGEIHEELEDILDEIMELLEELY